MKNKISKSTYSKLHNLSENQLWKLADIMGIGINFNFEPKEDIKEELIVVLSTESEKNILAGLKKFISNKQT